MALTLQLRNFSTVWQARLLRDLQKRIRIPGAMSPVPGFCETPQQQPIRTSVRSATLATNPCFCTGALTAKPDLNITRMYRGVLTPASKLLCCILVRTFPTKQVPSREVTVFGRKHIAELL